MSLVIQGVSTGGTAPDHGRNESARITAQVQRLLPPVHNTEISHDNPPPDVLLRELFDIPELYNRRLKFAINRDLDMVTVKIIDAETDKVIKEIPPEELQRMHSRIREAIGLLIDERI
jgi:flagellar protein FlaG